MKRIDLREYQTTQVALDRSEFAALCGYRSDLSLTVEPCEEEGVWCLTPASTIGALEIGDFLSVSIRPKLDIARVLFLASYALGDIRLRDLEHFDFPEKDTPVEPLVRLFVVAAERAFSHGLLHGYRTEEEALYTVRGRIRFADQIRRQFGVPLPVEIRYDDFTEDIPANRLVKAATHALGAMRLRDPRSRTQLGRVAGTLENVRLVAFPPQSVPDVPFDRLNEHYREVTGLARLILQHATLETGRGQIRAAGFLMDMNRVFEGFVRRALREELELAERAFPAERVIPFDKEEKIKLKPDLSWWEDRKCIFVGDAKYKRIEHKHAPNADLYQLLAYATALGLPGGMLVYAKGEERPAVHEARHTRKQLEVVALDLAGEPAAILAQISELATRVRALALRAPIPRAA